MKHLEKVALSAGQLLLSSTDLSPILVPGPPRSCPANPPLSCQVPQPLTDSCCFNSPGGQFAQTQFWNSDETKGPPGYLGPKESWTIHGLWFVVEDLNFAR
jgi:ribonuclease T2